MEQRGSFKADGCSANHDIPHAHGTKMFRYRCHKSTQRYSFLNQMKLIQKETHLVQYISIHPKEEGKKSYKFGLKMRENLGLMI
jgi:hypothetical protein